MANLVSTVSWVKRGVAKRLPDKVKIEKEQLEKLITDLKAEIGEDESSGVPRKRKTPKQKSTDTAATIDTPDIDEAPDGEESTSEGSMGEQEVNDVEGDTDDPYDLEHYDDDDGDTPWESTIAGLAVYADNSEDPYVTIPDEDDDEEERQDYEIKPTDNLIVAGRAAPECSLLEVYVFSESEAALYCHHDIVLPAFPLATAWLNYDVETKQPGNLIAVGSMENTIAIWELDVVDAIEPMAVLGTTNKAKKKKKSDSATSGMDGHSDAVLDLAWHMLAPTALASASADKTSAIWDLSEGKQILSLKHKDKVQTIQWHPNENSVLLTGALDHVIRLFDCRQQNQSCLKWKIKGEVERVTWDVFSPFHFFAGADSGDVYYMDSRKETTPIYTLQAHRKAVTGLSQCLTYTGCLVTVSMDASLKVWDTANASPSCIFEKKIKDQGGLTCTSCCPDLTTMFVIGSEKSLTLYDINESSQVRKHFSVNDDDATTKLESLKLEADNSDDEELKEFLGEATAVPSNGLTSTQASQKPKKKAKRRQKS